jgi:carboxymethylenebutenolidase
MALRDYLTGEVAQDFSDGLLTRRDALHRLGLMGMSAAGAATLLAACAGDGTATAPPSGTGSMVGTGGSTAPVPPTGTVAAPPGAAVRFAGPAGELQGAWAAPADPRGAVLVIHENRGLMPHFFDLVGRFAAERYAALAVDLVSAEGGTAAITDPAQVPAILSGASQDRLVGDLRAGIDELGRRVPGAKIGAVGFCFGGGMTWSLLQAGESRLAAAAPFYGPAPEQPDFSRAAAAVLAVYGELDTRVNATRDRAEAALKAAGRPYEIRTFAGADHAFFNDTGPRYNAAAAQEAWTALLGWYGRHLA